MSMRLVGFGFLQVRPFQQPKPQAQIKPIMQSASFVILVVYCCEATQGDQEITTLMLRPWGYGLRQVDRFPLDPYPKGQKP